MEGAVRGITLLQTAEADGEGEGERDGGERRGRRQGQGQQAAGERDRCLRVKRASKVQTCVVASCACARW
jgi:hypothetical protein